MGAIISTASSFCLGASCSACSSVSSTTRSYLTRGTYVVLFLVVSVVAYLCSNWAFTWMSHVPYVPPVFEACPPNSVCYGALAVYRITFGLTLFHLIQALMMFGVTDTANKRASIQDGWFLLKILLLVGMIVAAFWIPNSLFVAYGWVSVFGAGGFIVIQLVLLIEFAYNWNQTWVSNMEDDHAQGRSGKKWFWGLLIFTGAMILGFLAMTIAMYKLFCVREGCGLNTTFVTVNLVLTVFLCLLGLHPAVRRARPSAGLLQSSMIMVYTTRLVWSAIVSEPTSSCNPFADDDSKANDFNVSLFLGAAFTLVFVCYSTFRASSSSGHFSLKDAESAPLLEDSAGGEDSGPVKYNYSFFHFTFALGAMYLCMIITNWMILSKDTETTVSVDTGMVSVWVKMASGWLTIALYIWSLVAPIILPNRDWNY
eukprot:TRINITY_DN7731_c0_g1_i1.p1 TRINITY_DN7731_c0_g1~~TRINITY_DN7731_c0_g1_i1.p1  ORF type:complete len:426 (+),score=78.15 TRINITY_DN7731_c0_g1_i1:34-1311(+)